MEQTLEMFFELCYIEQASLFRLCTSFLSVKLSVILKSHAAKVTKFRERPLT